MTEQAHHAPIVHTTAEAAVILRVKESWLERQAQLRKIPSMNSPGLTGIPTADCASAWVMSLHGFTESGPASEDAGPIEA